MYERFVFPLILLTLIACARTPTAGSSPTSPPLPTQTPPLITSLAITDGDKAEIIKLTTGWAIGSLPDNHELPYQESSVLLDTENLNPDWIPTLDDVQLVPQTRAQIQQVAESESRNIMYLSFSEVEFGDDGKAVITVYNVWAVPQGGDFPLSGGAGQLEFKRVNGEWKWTVLWIMVS
jgi:hypothetical protein